MNRTLTILGLSVSALVLLGIMMLYSATVAELVPHRLYAHLIWLSIGVAAGAGVALADYRKLQQWRLPWLLLGLTLLLLVSVLVPGIGLRINGARRWLLIGGQPSEFAKLGIIVWLADFGSRHATAMAETRKGFIYPGLVCALAAGLVFIEPDWGTAALLVAVSLAMLLISGTRSFYILAVATVGIATLALLVCYDPVHFARVLSFWDPEKYQEGIGWQGWHSVLSIGVGGLYGTWCGEGSHKYGFVPEQQTDFIFSLIGEELGLIGTTAVVSLFCAIIACGARIVWRIADRFGQMLASGLTILIGLQALINIGVCTSSLPNKGLPLPFVSYGGSSLVCMLVAVGLLVSVARHATRTPTYAAAKRPPAKRSPFAAPAYPHCQHATDLAGVLLGTKPRKWARVVSWFRRWKAKRHPRRPAHAYQLPPCKHNPFAEPVNTKARVPPH